MEIQGNLLQTNLRNELLLLLLVEGKPGFAATENCIFFGLVLQLHSVTQCNGKAFSLIRSYCMWFVMSCQSLIVRDHPLLVSFPHPISYSKL